AEADALRDEMDAPWYAMSEAERRRVGGLSEDLYSLAEGGAKQVAMTREERQRWAEEAKAALSALQRGDYDTPLSFLRRPYPEDVPRHAIPFLQSRCWERLGDMDVAILFMKEAERHDPQEAVSVLSLLQQADRTQEAVEYANRILDSAHSTPIALYLAAGALLRPTRRMKRKEARPLLERVVPALRRALR